MKQRNYGIELLRLVLMYMICILHILGRGGILEAYDSGTIQFKVFYLLETLAYPAVDSFAIISGYYAQDKPPNYMRLVEMWIQVFFYSCIVSLFLILTGISNQPVNEPLINSFFPVSSKQYWYFTAYFGAFFFFYPIRLFVFRLKESRARLLLIIFFVLFSVMEMNRDIFTLDSGYSMLWLMILYMMGLLSKRCHLFEKTKTPLLILLFIVCTLATWIMFVLTEMDILLQYTSPAVLLCGLLLVILFSRLKLNGKIIGKISPFAFGIYLFQLNFIVWNDLKDATVKRLSSDVGTAVLQIFLFAAVLFVCGLTADVIRQKLTAVLRIPELSEMVFQELKKKTDK